MVLLLLACAEEAPAGAEEAEAASEPSWLELRVYEGEELLLERSTEELECYDHGLELLWFEEDWRLELDLSPFSGPGRYHEALEVLWSEGPRQDWVEDAVCWMEVEGSRREPEGSFACYLAPRELWESESRRRVEGSFRCAYVMTITW